MHRGTWSSSKNQHPYDVPVCVDGFGRMLWPRTCGTALGHALGGDGGPGRGGEDGRAVVLPYADLSSHGSLRFGSECTLSPDPGNGSSEGVESDAGRFQPSEFGAELCAEGAGKGNVGIITACCLKVRRLVRYNGAMKLATSGVCARVPAEMGREGCVSCALYGSLFRWGFSGWF